MLLDQPELFDHLAWVWEVYIILDRSRQFGFNGPQPIMLSDIEAYARLHDVTDRSDLIRYIQLMDGEYISHEREKLKKEQKRGRTSRRNKG